MFLSSWVHDIKIVSNKAHTNSNHLFKYLEHKACDCYVEVVKYLIYRFYITRFTEIFEKFTCKYLIYIDSLRKFLENPNVFVAIAFEQGDEKYLEFLYGQKFSK